MLNIIKHNKFIQRSITAVIILFVVMLFIAINKETDNASPTSKYTIANANISDMTITEMPTLKAGFVLPEIAILEDIHGNKSSADTDKLIDFDAKHPFSVSINRAENFAVIYGIDENGDYTIPYKAFICSTGLNPEDTPLGIFKMSDKYRWRLMVDNTYAQYAIRIEGQIMLHSVPYVDASSDTLEYWEYNKLGTASSLGCIRFKTAAIKWIYKHCNSGSTVIIYDEPGEVSPIKIPRLKKLKKSNPKSVWDPTDPDKNNPWKNKNYQYSAETKQYTEITETE